MRYALLLLLSLPCFFFDNVQLLPILRRLALLGRIQFLPLVESSLLARLLARAFGFALTVFPSRQGHSKGDGLPLGEQSYRLFSEAFQLGQVGFVVFASAEVAEYVGMALA